MKKIPSALLGLLFVLLSMSACSKVPAGHVGVKVFMLGGAKGVESEQLGVGRYWIGFNEELFLFPTFTQNYVWAASKTEGKTEDESISFQTIEGMSVGADVGISYAVRPEKVSVVFQKYRKDLEEITHVYLRNMVRDAFVTVASGRPVEDVYGAGKAKLLKDVEEHVKEQCGDMFIIERIYLVGDLRLPTAVTQALNLKIQATQQAQQVENEIRASKAQAEKKIAEAEGDAKSTLVRAESQAKANRLLAESITPTLVQYRSLEKWDGKLPTTMLPGTATPFIGVK